MKLEQLYVQNYRECAASFEDRFRFCLDKGTFLKIRF